MNVAIAGTLESSDVLITVKNSDKRIIELESIVYNQFGDQILKAINSTLDELNIDNLHVICQDKGALDYTIKARLKTAIKRMEEK